MLVVEKTHHIKAEISGDGSDLIADLVLKNFPDAEILNTKSDFIVWNDSDLEKSIRVKKTPGKLLRAYRERAGLSVIELAKKVGTSYPNISAIENDRRVIGLRMAKKLGKVLNVEYTRFLS